MLSIKHLQAGVLFVLALHTGGCVTWRTAPVPPAQLLAAGNPRTLRVTRKDSSGAGSVRVVLDKAILRGDSLEGIWRRKALSVRIPITDVQEIATPKIRSLRTLGLVVGVLGGILMLISFATYDWA